MKIKLIHKGTEEKAKPISDGELLEALEYIYEWLEEHDGAEGDNPMRTIAAAIAKAKGKL